MEWLKVIKNEETSKKTIPKEWIVPNENGIWRAATSDYYSIILNKESNRWKILRIIKDDMNNEKIPENSSSKFINTLLPNFPPPPKNIIELPEDIKMEIANFSVKITTNEIPERPFPDPPNPAVSQEWHINLYSNYNPSYSWTWNPCQDYYAIYNIEGSQYGFVYRYLTTYINLSKGDIVNLDQNNNNYPDHVGIVVAFAPDGTPLVDAHTSDRWHVSWRNLSSLFHCIHIDYENGYHY